MNRRQFLTGAAVATTAGIAGCSGSDGSEYGVQLLRNAEAYDWLIDVRVVHVASGTFSIGSPEIEIEIRLRDGVETAAIRIGSDGVFGTEYEPTAVLEGDDTATAEVEEGSYPLSVRPKGETAAWYTLSVYKSDQWEGER